MRSSTIYAVGETVFDIIFRNYQATASRPGGSSFNAAISLGRLGVPVSFISEVGNDRIGRYIRSFLDENGVDSRYVLMFDSGKSALALAFLNEESDAEYDFYKDYPRQRLKEALPEFTENDYLLFGSYYGLNPAVRPQVRKILSNAVKHGSLIYYDPNFRSGHLHELEHLRPVIEYNFKSSTIIRASDEDMFNIYGVKNPGEAWEKVSGFCRYFIYTANAHGVDMITPDFRLHLDVDPIVPVSTIGAGDNFNAGVLYGLHKRGVSARSLEGLDMDEWLDILKVAAEFSREVCLSYDNYVSLEYSRQINPR